VDFFLPSKVLHYIQNNNLYEGDYYGRDRWD
jgi:nicotinic acid mononucleotide adenylyltransferase